jgi:hypothetical protein
VQLDVLQRASRFKIPKDRLLSLVYFGCSPSRWDHLLQQPSARVAHRSQCTTRRRSRDSSIRTSPHAYR